MSLGIQMKHYATYQRHPHFDQHVAAEPPKFYQRGKPLWGPNGKPSPHTHAHEIKSLLLLSLVLP